MPSTENPRSGARARTRRAILRAAATVLSRDRNAPLSSVAEVAEVGRSTLHRYFPEREDLVAATFEEAFAELGRVMEEARVDEGPATEALRRVVAAHVEAGEWVLFAFGDPADQPQGVEESEPEPAFLVDLVRRGQSEGGIAADLDPVWVVNVVWALVFTGMEQVQAGRLSRHAVAATVVRTLEGGVLARA